LLPPAEVALASAGGRTHSAGLAEDEPRRTEHEEELHADSVFAKLKSLKRDDDEE
jgi:hypothetical protein